MSIIHVNSHVIRSNAKNGALEPPLSVRRTKSASPERCHEVIILGQDGKEAARIIYSPDKPLSCGARLWIEADSIITEVTA